MSAAAAVPGTTPSLLSYWARTGLAGPSAPFAKGSHSWRPYDAQDIPQLEVVKRLLEGISLQQIWTAIQQLRERSTEDGPR